MNPSLLDCAVLGLDSDFSSAVPSVFLVMFKEGLTSTRTEMGAGNDVSRKSLSADATAGTSEISVRSGDCC